MRLVHVGEKTLNSISVKITASSFEKYFLWYIKLGYAQCQLIILSSDVFLDMQSVFYQMSI